MQRFISEDPIGLAGGDTNLTRSYGKGKNPDYINPQRRRSYCDGIQAFAIAERYPMINRVPCE